MASDLFLRILAVAAGGAAGSAVRYLINISPIAGLFGKFPFATMLINVSGSFLIGFFLIILTDKLEVGDLVRLAVIVGFLGGFTTFSTFEMDLYGLVRENYILTAFLYLFISLFAGFAGLVAGISLARQF